jgi:hypothetical protein
MLHYAHLPIKAIHFFGIAAASIVFDLALEEPKIQWSAVVGDFNFAPPAASGNIAEN